MSDLFATILAMEKWTKYTYVCDPDECDSLIEFTCKDTFGFPSGSVTNITCPCGRKPQLLSVEDATILSTTDPKGNKMQTMTESYAQEMELKFGNRITELENELSGVRQNREYWLAENGRIQSQVIELINHLVEEDVDQDEIVTTLSEIVDYQPKKEIEFTATIRFTGRMEVDALEYKDNFDLSDILGEAYVDINHGDVVIDGYELEDAEEC
jgi:hypothetical protein